MASYDVKAFESKKSALFKNTETLPSLVCRRRFLDAMLIQREFKQGTSSFSKRVSADDQARLVRDRLYVLKQCVLAGKDTDAGKEPYLYHLH